MISPPKEKEIIQRMRQLGSCTLIIELLAPLRKELCPKISCRTWKASWAFDMRNGRSFVTWLPSRGWGSWSGFGRRISRMAENCSRLCGGFAMALYFLLSRSWFQLLSGTAIRNGAEVL